MSEDILKNIANPEAWIMRDKFRASASRGELPHTDCTHSLQLIQQYMDDDPTIKRNSRPVNLFACGVCGMHLWLVDPWGVVVGDR